MSKLFSSGPAKSDTPNPMSKKTAAMEFFPAKGLGSYHCFALTEDKGKKLFRSAVLQYGSLAALPNADQALASVLPRGFVEEASTHGWALKEAMQEAQAYYTTHAPAPKAKRDSVDYDTRRLCGILAALSPDASPQALLVDLKELIQVKAEAALKRLEQMEHEAGRDSEGFIYLRRVKR